jgi:hypothetical protein
MTMAEVANRMLESYPRDYYVDREVLVRCHRRLLRLRGGVHAIRRRLPQ